MSSRSQKRRKQRRERTLILDGGSVTMSPKVINIHCKRCDKDFTRLEWMQNKVCDNPECNCPEIRKTMQQATDVINKAKESSRVNHIKTTTTTIPTGYIDDVNVDQLEIDVPPITVIEITPPKRK
jgi:hypothetical protein